MNIFMYAKKNHTQKELAEALVFPVTLSSAQRKEAAEQLAVSRKELQHEMTEMDQLTLRLLQLKFQLEDYIESKKYDPEQHFGSFLKRYIDILGVKRKAFAKDISIDETMLSQFINRHRTPPDYIIIRLELHSNSIIPAYYWYRLVEKHLEFRIKSDKTLRKKEQGFVHKIAV